VVHGLAAPLDAPTCPRFSHPRQRAFNCDYDFFSNILMTFRQLRIVSAALGIPRCSMRGVEGQFSINCGGDDFLAALASLS
jgi:hypothetical protein